MEDGNSPDLTLNYARTTEAKGQFPPNLASLSERLTAGTVELFAVFVLFTAANLLPPIGSTLPAFLLFASLIALEMLPQNFGRWVNRLRVLYVPRPSLRKVIIRAFLCRPFSSAMCLGLSADLIA